MSVVAAPICAPPFNPSSGKFTFPSTPACWAHPLQLALLVTQRSSFLLHEVTVSRRFSLWGPTSNEIQPRFTEPSHAMESAQLADHELSDDMSIEYDLSLGHAPTNSHATYLAGIMKVSSHWESIKKADTIPSISVTRSAHMAGTV